MTKIYTEQLYDCTWAVYDENYDGAPDAGPQIVGYGVTEAEALDEFYLGLRERYDDWAYVECDICGAHERKCYLTEYDDKYQYECTGEDCV